MAHPQLLGDSKNRKWQFGQSQSFEKQSEDQANLTDKVHLLHNTNLSKLGEASVLSMFRNQHRIKKNTETMGCVPTKGHNNPLANDLNEIKRSEWGDPR